MKIERFDWQQQAACKGKPPSFFFLDEEGIHSKNSYKAVCSDCPVKNSCLEISILEDFEGVWGGLTDKERWLMYPEGYRQQLREEMEELGLWIPLPYNRSLAS